jgi:hypothetical protein
LGFPFFPHRYFSAIFSILQDQGIKNLAAKYASPFPERFPRAVESFISHDPIAAMTLHKGRPHKSFIIHFPLRNQLLLPFSSTPISLPRRGSKGNPVTHKGCSPKEPLVWLPYRNSADLIERRS